jgi:hypothetical protein
MNPTRNLLKLFFFSFFICMVLISGAQGISIKIKKGTAKVNDTLYDATGQLIAIKANDLVVVSQNSMVIAMSTNKMVELKPGIKYTCKQINDLINKSSASFTSDFLKVIFSEPMQKSKQKQSGGLTRGSTGGVLSDYYPEDDMIILSDQVLLDCGYDSCRLIGNLLVLHESTGEIMYNNAPEKNKLLLKVVKPGTYTWGYTILCKTDKQEVRESYKNIFVVPDMKSKENILSEVDTFKKNIQAFSTELQQECMSLYLYNHRYYIYEAK